MDRKIMKELDMNVINYKLIKNAILEKNFN